MGLCAMESFFFVFVFLATLHAYHPSSTPLPFPSYISLPPSSLPLHNSPASLAVAEARASNGSMYLAQSPTPLSAPRSSTITWLIINMGVPYTFRKAAYLNEKRTLPDTLSSTRWMCRGLWPVTSVTQEATKSETSLRVFYGLRSRWVGGWMGEDKRR